MYLTYDKGTSFGYEQKIIKRGGKTSTWEIYLNEFFFLLPLVLDVFLKERILDPLGMVDTHFYLPAEKTSRLSVVYNQEDNKLVRADDDGEEELDELPQ